jgi:Rieske 2Fe-2S family protein
VATRTARTLPARAYTDPDVYERERREVFARSWILACHASEVAEPGRFRVVDVAGEPVAVIRGQDGVLRALSNVCRHRASTILDGSGTCPKVLRCPYHGWTYRQDGQLAAVPEARGFDDLDREAVRLPSFGVAELFGLVFVNLDADAEPLDGWFGDLHERLGPLNIGSLVPDRPHVTVYEHNWKVIADNYLEGYHIPVGHPSLLRLLDYKRYDPKPGLRHSWIDGPLREKPSKNRLERLYQRLLKPMSGFPDELRDSWTYVHLWPATFVDIYPDQIDTWHLQPLGPRRTRAVTTVYRPEDESPRARLVRRLNWKLNDLVMDEDVELCDGVQLGLESLTYERGVLNRNEAAVLHFHDQLRQAVPGIDDA